MVWWPDVNSKAFTKRNLYAFYFFWWFVLEKYESLWFDWNVEKIKGEKKYFCAHTHTHNWIGSFTNDRMKSWSNQIQFRFNKLRLKLLEIVHRFHIHETCVGRCVINSKRRCFPAAVIEKIELNRARNRKRKYFSYVNLPIWMKNDELLLQHLWDWGYRKN